MVEYHVDNMVLEENEEQLLPDGTTVNKSAANVNLNNFRGNLSVRFPAGEKPLVIIGDDKTISSSIHCQINKWQVHPISEG